MGSLLLAPSYPQDHSMASKTEQDKHMSESQNVKETLLGEEDEPEDTVIIMLCGKIREELAGADRARRARCIRKYALKNGENGVVYGLCTEKEVGENDVSIMSILSGSLVSEISSQHLVAFVRSLPDALELFYKVKPGRYDGFADCSIQWSPSIVPLYMEVQLRFHDDRQQQVWLTGADWLADQENPGADPNDTETHLSKGQLDAFRSIRDAVLDFQNKEEEKIKDEVNEALQNPITRKIWGPDCYEVLLRITRQNHDKTRKNYASEKFSALLTLSDDPVNDWDKWETPLATLAHAVNHRLADLSAFDNLKRISDVRYRTWLEAQQSSHTSSSVLVSQTLSPEAVTPKPSPHPPYQALASQATAPQTPSQHVAPKRSKKKKKRKRSGKAKVSEPEDTDFFSAPESLSPQVKAPSGSISDSSIDEQKDSYFLCPENQSDDISSLEVLEIPATSASMAEKRSNLHHSDSTSSLLDGDKPLAEAYHVSISGANDTQSDMLSEPCSSLEENIKKLSVGPCAQQMGHDEGVEAFPDFVQACQSPEHECPTTQLAPPTLKEPNVPSSRLQRRSNTVHGCSLELKKAGGETDSVAFQPKKGSAAKGDCESECEDLSDAEATPQQSRDQSYLPGDAIGVEPPAYQPWAFTKPWMYFEDGLADQSLFHPDVTPFLKPPGWLPESGNSNPLPIKVLGTRVQGKQPFAAHDLQNGRILVVPHVEPLADLRQLTIHPDWLPANKLVEYQAAEICGHAVWRHDRSTLKCALPECNNICKDHELTTQLCLGCGPCSTIRYCSKTHQFEDLKEHWEECGHPGTLIQQYIDMGTQPGRFRRRYPAIEDIGEWRSFEKHRQRLFAIWNRGKYTLFVPNRDPQAVIWPTFEEQDEYGPRVERLLNAAFFDQTRDDLVEYLFYLVRMALRKSGKYTRNVADALHEQFIHEFDWDSTAAREEDPCECRWFGNEADERKCSKECKDFYTRWNLVNPRSGVRHQLEALEAKNWILRIWQRQHPTIPGWRRRLAGHGFPGATIRDLNKEAPLMGKGWQGFGALETLGGFEPIE